MKCVFRVDASNVIGTGHVMRCRTLANAMKKLGADVQFITRAHPGHLGDMLASDGFAVTLLPKPEVSEIAKGDYAAWLGVSQQEDGIQTIHALENKTCDWLVVDHYGIDQIWEVQLQPHARKLMVIDDLANRNHVCDVLLDQNYAISVEDRYQSRVPSHSLMLLGPKYALLRPEYAQYRAKMAPRSGDIKRILVYLGGADNEDTTGKVITALCAAHLSHLEVDVVIGVNYIHKTRVINQACARPNTHVHGPRQHLADLMTNADLAIGGGGVTTLERLCMGLPSLVISIAENQVPTCKAMSLNSLLQYLGNAHDLCVTDIELALDNGLAEYVKLRDFAVANQEVVDGRGTETVLSKLKSLL